MQHRLAAIRVGAHLYGTATPASDTDLKFVFVPAARDILLQRARPSVTEARRQSGDTDADGYSLQRFLDLVLAGQPVALEMLFAPDSACITPPHGLWQDVRALAPHLVSRQVAPFLSYCRQQADLYGGKGARAAAARAGLALLEAAEAAHGSAGRLGLVEPALAELSAQTPYAGLLDIPVGGGRIVRHFNLCGRKVPLHASIKAARELASRLLAEYGARTLRAEEDGGIDWKALSHAVRIGHEALELLATGRLCFPLASAGHLLDIKLGRVGYAAVTEEIEALLGAVEAAERASVLPAEPDRDAAEALVLAAYRQQVLHG